MSQKVLDALTAKHAHAIDRTESQHGDEIAWIKRDELVEVATWLRDDPAMAFDAPVFCDLHRSPRLAPGRPAAERAWTEDKPRFEVVYQLRSQTHRHRIRLKIAVPEHDARCPSLAELWPAFNWQERETFDMYGIQFEGHPDLRRIYMYEEFVGYPLRKDYPKEKRQPLVRRDDLRYRSTDQGREAAHANGRRTQRTRSSSSCSAARTSRTSSDTEQELPPDLMTVNMGPSHPGDARHRAHRAHRRRRAGRRRPTSSPATCTAASRRSRSTRRTRRCSRTRTASTTSRR